MDITLVTLPDSQIRTEGLYTEINAGVVVENIDISPTLTNDPSVLIRVRDEIAGKYPYYPDNKDLKIFRIVLRGFNTDSMTGIVTFQSTQFDAVSSYILKFSAYATVQETNLVPGTRVPISVGWEGEPKMVPPAGGGSGPPSSVTPSIPKDLVTMRFKMPALSVSISGLTYGNPPTGFQEGVAYVNNQIWPVSLGSLIRPKPTGYWMLDKYELAFAKYKGYFNYEAVVSSRVFADWSETGVLTNRQSGRHVEVSPEAVSAMNGMEYAYGIIYADKGIIRVGGNPTIDMQSVMGF